MSDEPDRKEEKESVSGQVDGSGSVAQDGGTAAGKGGVAAGRDIGDVNIIQPAEVSPQVIKYIIVGMIAVVLITAVLIAFVLFWTKDSGEQATPLRNNTSEPATETEPLPTHTMVVTAKPPADAEKHDTLLRSTDDMLMVYVPGGTFQMGSDDDDVVNAMRLCNENRDDCKRERLEPEMPAHSVTLDSYWIDKYEVSTVQFAGFLVKQGNQNEGGATWLDVDNEYSLIEREGSKYRPKTGFEKYPVTEVSWYGAAAYCRWAGGRLPTEAEWEYAARGTDGTTFPWGNTFYGDRLNFCDINCEYDHADPDWDDGYVRTAPVGNYDAGASWCGAQDMAGNVWEWVADWYSEYPSTAQTNPTGPEGGDVKVMRGGSWSLNDALVRSAFRDGYNPDDGYYRVGFRCVVASSP